eukprot:TRINITY_DN28465_c0_g1_i1.p1 TRINITY_DN28465_c0_g1~~TRINITY_DN28465_c0_g1_i1.p1  ORF type:complete len:217 (+),score=23.03 TRINITY_DN28465_c0_g1_i1:76-651(+)
MFRVSLVVVLVTLSWLQCGAGMQLVVDPQNPCVATGNGTRFDISKVFSYPVHIVQNPYQWVYHWNPCAPVDCRQPGGAICQKSDALYMSGVLADAIWNINSFPNATGDGMGYKFSIMYPNGFQWRMSTIRFIQDPSLVSNTITFDEENPYEEYQFTVRGPCLGAPAWGTTNCPEPTSVPAEPATTRTVQRK